MIPVQVIKYHHFGVSKCKLQVALLLSVISNGFQQKSKNPNFNTPCIKIMVLIWRSRRDSNPRSRLRDYSISSRARYDHFDTAPKNQLLYKSTQKQNNVEPKRIQRHMVRRMGLEPTREYSHYPLKVARLPFRHLRRFALQLYYYINNAAKSQYFLQNFFILFTNTFAQRCKVIFLLHTD